jgi:2-oxo-4-hydroxy-4-carboxy--5-ureidoimidazoline (OHCU) decarboxylase
VRGLTRAGIIAAMRQRLDNTMDEERAASLREVGRIAQLRLQDLIKD